MVVSVRTVIKPKFVEKRLFDKLLPLLPPDGRVTIGFRLPTLKPVITEGLLPNEIRMIESLRQKKIDVLVERETEDWIMELKGQMDMKMLGQLMTYKNIYQTRVKMGRKVKLVAVVEKADEELMDAFKEARIEVIELPEE